MRVDFIKIPCQFIIIHPLGITLLLERVLVKKGVKLISDRLTSVTLAVFQTSVDNDEEFLSRMRFDTRQKLDVVPDSGSQMFPDISLMNAWFNSHGFEAEIARLREIHPQLMDLKSWLEKHDVMV